MNLSTMEFRTLVRLSDMMFVVNFIRGILLQIPLRFVRCNVSRTPFQLYRRIKRKRINREWATQKKWRKRHGWPSLRSRQEQEIMDKFLKMIETSTEVMKDMREQRELAGR